MGKLERRMFATDLKLETRDGEAAMIRGRAAVFNALSGDMGFKERIRPGAFTRSLSKVPDVRALFNHNPSFILGRTKSGTLRLVEDDMGLAYEIDPPDTQVAHDLMESLKRGDVDQSSFGFYVVTDEWHNENGEMIRELIEVDIDGGDVSPVTYPAYAQTKAEARAMLWPEGMPEQVRSALENSDGSTELRGQLAAEIVAKEAAEQALVVEKESRAADKGAYSQELAIREATIAELMAARASDADALRRSAKELSELEKLVSQAKQNIAHRARLAEFTD